LLPGPGKNHRNREIGGTFRADRIERAKPLKQRYPKRRRVLLKDWRITQDIPEQFQPGSRGDRI
jgi:hypothetical protein